MLPSTPLALSLLVSSIVTQCSAFVVSPVRLGGKFAPTPAAVSQERSAPRFEQAGRRRGCPLAMGNVDPLIDSDKLTEIRAKFADSSHLGELLTTLKGRGFSVESESGDVLELGDEEEEAVPDSPAEAEAEETTDAPAEEAAPPAEPAAKLKEEETPVEEVKEDEKVEEVVAGAGEEGLGLGAGGMADTRDPEELDHNDPRKSISAAPTFEEYLKARSSA